MLQLYHSAAKRLEVIKRYRAVMTHSDYLKAEYIRHGISEERVHSVVYCVQPLLDAAHLQSRNNAAEPEAWHLAFAGRMDALKGGGLLVDCLPALRARSGKPIHLVLAGDGPERQKWERAALQVMQSTRDVSVEFTGWLTDRPLAELFDASDLLVMPSILPEAFGLVGVQAGFQGLPAVAFDVGGIAAWLVDGVTGHLAPGNPPTADGLVRTIMKCLGNGDHYLKLRRGAAEMARRFLPQAHIDELLTIFRAAAG
jgi:glycosyltransferase involved in cell wall biosynthesis